MSEPSKPLQVNGGHREILVSSWRAHQKNTLRGFLTLTLPSGLVIHDCTFHERDGSRWIGLAARQFKKEDGSIGYAPLIEFTSSESRQRFQAAALDAVLRHLEAQGV